MNVNGKSEKISKISVIVPVYNTEQYIERCLNSVLHNTYHNLEVICVNDGSTDNSLEILEKMANIDSRVRIINKKNGGVSAARNDALKVATGEYISFVDSDDWVHSQYFEIMYNAIRQYDGDCIVCEMQKVNSCDVAEKEFPTVLVEKLDFSQCMNNHLVRGFVCGRLYVREALNQILFDKNCKLNEDLVFNVMFLCAKKDVKVLWSHEPLYFYFCRADSAVHNLEGTEILPSIDAFLEQLQREDLTDMMKTAIAVCSYKALLSYRYLCMFESRRKEIKNNFKIRSCILREYIKKISFKERVIYKVFTNIPFSYRVFRILNDKTLLEWEKNKKENK